MKVVLIFAALIAGITASAVPKVGHGPHTVAFLKNPDARFVDNIVSAALEDLSRQIRELGLDPFVLDRLSTGYDLPVPVLLSLDAFVQNVRVTGLSNIVINHINYGILSGRLTMDISIPDISISVGDAAFDVTILGHNIAGRTNSRISIIEPRIFGFVQVNLLGAITGNLITNIQLEFDLQALRYDGSVVLQGVEYNGFFNNFISNVIPAAINNVRAEINELVEMIAWQIVDTLL